MKAYADLGEKQEQLDMQKSLRGFALQEKSKIRETAIKGGQSVPKEKRSFSTNRKLASESGRKGGKNVPKEARSFSMNRELAQRAGRKGGKKAQENKKNARNSVPSRTFSPAD